MSHRAPTSHDQATPEDATPPDRDPPRAENAAPPVPRSLDEQMDTYAALVEDRCLALDEALVYACRDEVCFVVVPEESLESTACEDVLVGSVFGPLIDVMEPEMEPLRMWGYYLDATDIQEKNSYSGEEVDAMGIREYNRSLHSMMMYTIGRAGESYGWRRVPAEKPRDGAPH